MIFTYAALKGCIGIVFTQGCRFVVGNIVWVVLLETIRMIRCTKSVLRRDIGLGCRYATSCCELDCIVIVTLTIKKFYSPYIKA